MKHEYYLVRYGWGFQHGDNIETVYMTEKEFEKMKNKNPFEKAGAYFDNYESALYYTMD